MRRDGTLTKAEERCVSNAMGIIGRWLSEHLHDAEQDRPRGYWDVYTAHRDLEGVLYVMTAE